MTRGVGIHCERGADPELRGSREARRRRGPRARGARPGPDEQHGERDDDVGDPRDGDDRARQRARERRDCDQEHREGERLARRHVDHVLRREHVHEAHQRSDRQVDPARDDDDRLRHRGEGERRRVDRERLDVERPHAAGIVRQYRGARRAGRTPDRPPVPVDEPPQVEPAWSRLAATSAPLTQPPPTSPCMARRSDPSSASGPAAPP